MSHNRRCSTVIATLSVTIAVIGGAPAAADDEPTPVYQVRMHASIDADSSQIHGSEILRWRNTSSVPVDELQFHLYLNAFANDRTTFMEGSGGQLRGIAMEDRRWGWIEVDQMLLRAVATPGESAGEQLTWPPSFAPGDEPPGVDLAEPVDLSTTEEILAPEDGNELDRTVARYRLPEAVPPGGWVEVEIGFTSQLPEIFARTGTHGAYVLAGQWFPKIGVFEDAGTRGRSDAGWNVHQFHPDSEFYADFGNWDVTLDLPASYAGTIGATGQLISETVEGNRVVAHFEQAGIHDFAWTADPDFVVIHDTFDPEKDVPHEQRDGIASRLGVDPAALELTPVAITLLLQPANRSQAERYLRSAKAAIRGYGLRLGAYPYPTLTLVDPPRGGLGSGGMEYQTFVTLGTHPALGMWPLREVRAPEIVTVHEFGHNYFQGMIANNEFEEAWIDEGINSYYEMVVMEEEYGNAIDLGGFHLSPFEMNHSAIAGGRFTDAIMQPSWSYRSNGSYGLNSYARPAVTLRHLENLIGPEKFAVAMRRFFQTWRFRHPSTADFERVIRETSDEDLDWFLDQAFHSDASLDYAVRKAVSRKRHDPDGWFWEDGERVPRGHLAHADDDADGSNVDDEAKDDVDETYRSEVVIQRRGEFIHPVEIELRFADGDVVRHQWDGRSRWIKYVEERSAKLESVEVDPDGLLALDVNRINNGRLIEADRRPRAKIVAQLLFWFQNLLAATSIVG